MATARDDFSWVPRYPAPVTLADVPEHLRDNPIVKTMLAMTPEEQAECERTARSDEADDEATIAMLLADAGR